jgi:NTE family protein
MAVLAVPLSGETAQLRAISMASAQMCASLLSAIPAFDGGTSEDLEALAAVTEQRGLRRGEVLIRQGEPSDALYFVLSGRFAVQVQGAAEPIAEIGQGQPIGEIGFFAGQPRTATVVAVRDSSVLAITRERFRQISECSPGIRDAVIVSLARRVSQGVGQVANVSSKVRTLAVISAGASRRSDAFLESLRAVLGSLSSTALLGEREVTARFPGAPLDDPGISRWLNSLESEYEIIFYIADQTLTEWTQKCIRQADALLLVAVAGASPELNPSELLAFSVHPRSARRLVILHENRTDVVSGTSSWLGMRDVFMHHHVALQGPSDIRRLFRFLAGRAIGFVAGGGGALGSAHLGAYKAFCEAGVEFDILGGTSVGAAMMAAFAYGVEAERVDEGTHNIFVRSRAFRRPTLPRYGLIDHKGFDRALRAEYGDVVIEDLWRPFFAVSSNLSQNKPMIHREGLVWQAVRASGSIPGVLPPFFTEHGEMLVDGALTDNVPLAPMKALKSGPNVIVMLGDDRPTTYSVDYNSIPGPLQLAAALLNPFSRQRLPQAPSVLQVIMLSMLANRHTDPQLSDTDILIRPELPVGLRFTSWERHNEIFLHAHRSSASWLKARIAETDPRVLALIHAKGQG